MFLTGSQGLEERKPPSLLPAWPPQDEEYAAAGAALGSREEAFGQDVVLKIHAPGGMQLTGTAQEALLCECRALPACTPRRPPCPCCRLGRRGGAAARGRHPPVLPLPRPAPRAGASAGSSQGDRAGAAVNGRPCPAGLGGRWRRMLLNASWVNGCVHRLMPRLKPLSL